MSFASDAVFAEIKSKINAEMVGNVGAVYKFKITNAAGKEKIWTVNARDGAGSVSNEDGDADCTIIIGDEDYVSLVSGKLNGMEAFMSGKLQIEGDMMLAQKLEDLAPSQASLAMNLTAAGEAAFGSDVAFAEIQRRLSPEMVGKVGAVFKFNITSATGQKKVWLVNARDGSGSVEEKDGDSDCTIIMNDEDFCQLITGKLNGMEAFMGGKLQIEGDMMLAQKLEELSGAQSSISMNLTAASDSFFASAFVFEEMAKRLNADLVAKVGATYKFVLTNHAGQKKSWFVDAKNGNGSISESDKEAECTLILTDSDYIDMVSGKLNSMEAFMGGKLTIEGDMFLAQKLEELQSAKAKL